MDPDEQVTQVTDEGSQASSRLAGEWLRTPWILASGLAAMGATAYLVSGFPAADLAAATYRSDLFARAGFTLRDSGWYAAHGHYLPAYSLLAPALGALLGVRAVLALAVVVASGLFGLIAARVFNPAAARAAASFFALGACVGLLSGRVPFDLGCAIGLGSLLALIDHRTRVAPALAILTSLASPIAGAFLALAGIALALTANDGKDGLMLALAALAPIALLALLFPEGGWEPFAASAFWPALAGVLLFAVLLPQGNLTARGRRAVRVGAILYALALAGSFALHTPVGGNSARLGALMAGPLVAGVLWGKQQRVLLLLLPLLIYWQASASVHDAAALAGDQSVNASYYAPLLSELQRLTGGRPTRLEIPMTGAHWEAAYVAGHDGISLARGWERQLDTRYATLFYRPGLTASAYRAWLVRNGVVYVGLADARLDYAAQAEGRLIRSGLPFLREVWRSPHWRLFALER